MFRLWKQYGWCGKLVKINRKTTWHSWGEGNTVSYEKHPLRLVDLLFIYKAVKIKIDYHDNWMIHWPWVKTGSCYFSKYQIQKQQRQFENNAKFCLKKN